MSHDFGTGLQGLYPLNPGIFCKKSTFIDCSAALDGLYHDLNLSKSFRSDKLDERQIECSKAISESRTSERASGRASKISTDSVTDRF